MVTAKKKKGQQRKASKANTNKNNGWVASLAAGVRKANHAATEFLSRGDANTEQAAGIFMMFYPPF